MTIASLVCARCPIVLPAANPLNAYRKRWAIAWLFGDAKTHGFITSSFERHASLTVLTLMFELFQDDIRCPNVIGFASCSLAVV